MANGETTTESMNGHVSDPGETANLLPGAEDQHGILLFVGDTLDEVGEDVADSGVVPLRALVQSDRRTSPGNADTGSQAGPVPCRGREVSAAR